MAARVWWLVALIACACHTVLGKVATWPGCSSQIFDKVVKARKINNDITELRLYNCDLTAISNDELKFYPNLESLFLSDNRISQIEAGTFDSLTKLSYLNLGSNRILGRNLPANLFKDRHPAGRITITLSNNDMQGTGADFLQGLDLNELSLYNCSLREFPLFVKRPVFPSMTALILENNYITRLDDPETFTNNSNLKLLFLDNNNIDFLHADLLRPLSRIESIYMSNNSIKFIPDRFFHNKTALRNIDLADNLIEHLPVDTFLGTKLSFLSLLGNRFTYLPVNFVTELQKTGVNLDVFYFHRNPWQRACLNELLIEVKNLSVTYEDSFEYDDKIKSNNDSSKCERK